MFPYKRILLLPVISFFGVMVIESLDEYLFLKLVFDVSLAECRSLKGRSLVSYESHRASLGITCEEKTHLSKSAGGVPFGLSIL